MSISISMSNLLSSNVTSKTIYHTILKSNSVGIGLSNKRFLSKNINNTSILQSYLGLQSLKPGETIKLNRNEIHSLLDTKDKDVVKALFNHAESVTQHIFGNKVFLRGIVEFSNQCEKNCKYCGVRRSNKSVKRYCMSHEDILKCGDISYLNGYGTLMLQSGEITNIKRIEWMEDLIRKLKKRTCELESKKFNKPIAECKGIQIALSIGELPTEYYQRLFDAGARRYLLRIESSNPKLYSKLHPNDNNHLWEKRDKCLHELQKVGYQTGTGILIGVPHQTKWDLADDILYLNKLGADMIGMGPYVYQENTPIGDEWKKIYDEAVTGKKIDMKKYNEDLVDLTIRMYALARITMGDSNIAATTALQALLPNAREIALKSGCNLVMPIITPDNYRKNYSLYQGKSEINSQKKKLISLIESIGKEPSFWNWADPLRYINRNKKSQIK